MTMEDEPEESLNDDERARRAAAAELQEQIDALARGEVTPSGRPQSLREFIEQREKRPAPEASPTQEQSSSDEGQQDKARRESADQSDV